MSDERRMQNRKLRIVGDEPVNSEVDLVLIAGVETSPVEEWAIITGWWRKFLATTDSKVRILTFDHLLCANDEITLGCIVEQGDILLNCLSQHMHDHKSPRPLLFMCHSIGSLILKQTLGKANVQSHQYNTLLHALLGIIFLGSPHSSDDPEALAESVLWILSSVASSNIAKQNSARLEDLRLLATTTRLFQDTQIRVEILSLYESQPTKVRIGRTSSKSKIGFNVKAWRDIHLVDEILARTATGHEQCYSLAGDHDDLCKLLEEPSRQPDQRLQNWLRFVLSRDARNDVEHYIYSAQLPDSPHLTRTSLSSFDMAKISLLGDSPANDAAPTNLIAPSASASGTGSGTMNAQISSSTLEAQWDVLPIQGSSQHRPMAKLPCFMVDTLVRNKDFFGRDDVLTRLDEDLLPEECRFSTEMRRTRHVALYGLGGLGKTSVAVEFAFSRRNKFDAVFWVRADEPAKLEQDFCQIASKLGLEDPEEANNPVVSRELAMGWMTSPKTVMNTDQDIVGQADATWLLIFDNADKPDILRDYWPLSGSGSILVTSRDPLSRYSPAIASSTIALEALDEEEGGKLLQRLCQAEPDSNRAAIISAKLGGLPLAICQMAAIIKEECLSYADFLEQYENDEERKELHCYKSEAPLPTTRGNLASIWAVDLLGPSAKALLEVLTLLDPDSIEERILVRDIPKGVLMTNFPYSKRSYAIARGDLLRRSLIKRNEENSSLWVHRVLQDSVRFGTSQAQMRNIFSTTVLLLLSTWGRTPLEKRHVTAIRNTRNGLFPHALRLKQMYENEDQKSELPSKLEFASLMCEAGWWQHERGNSEDSKSFFEISLEICGQTSGDELQQTIADTHYGLAAATNETNDAEACLHHTKILLDLRLQIFGATGIPDLRLAVAHNELGIAWVMNKQYENGIAAFNRSIEVFALLPEFMLAIDTNPRTNLGFTYWVIGDLESAEQMFVKLLCDREARFGLNDTESYRTGRIWHGLGNVRYDQGRMEESEELHRRALAHYQAILGNSNHKTADLMHRVAQHCLRRGDLVSAGAFIDHALKVWRSKGTIFTPEIARSCFLKVKVALRSGDTTKATLLLQDAASLRNRIRHAPYRDEKDLRDNDFDDLVTFYDR